MGPIGGQWEGKGVNGGQSGVHWEANGMKWGQCGGDQCGVNRRVNVEVSGRPVGRHWGSQWGKRSGGEPPGVVVRHWEGPWGDKSFWGVCVLGGTWGAGERSRGSPLTPSTSRLLHVLCAGGLWAPARAAAEALRDLGGLEVREHLGKVSGWRGHTWGA